MSGVDGLARARPCHEVLDRVERRACWAPAPKSFQVITTIFPRALVCSMTAWAEEI